MRTGLAKSGAGFRIVRASDGDSALRILRERRAPPAEERIDLVLLDINLPGKSGLDVLHEIKSDPALRSAPVIALTTSDADKDRALAYQRHVNSYLVKPVEYDRFLQLVDDFAAYWGRWNERPPR